MSGQWPDSGTSSLTGHILRQGRPDTGSGTGHGRPAVKLALGIVAGATLLIVIVGLLILTGTL